MGQGESKPLLGLALERLLEPPPGADSTAACEEWGDDVFRSPQTAEDVVAWMPLEQLRRLRDNAPHNFAALLLRVVEQLEHSVQGDAQQQTAAAAAAATEPCPPVPNGLPRAAHEQGAAAPPGGSALPLMPEAARPLALNCLRILCRLLPVVMEASEENEPATHSWLQALLWRDASALPKAEAAPTSAETAADAKAAADEQPTLPQWRVASAVDDEREALLAPPGTANGDESGAGGGPVEERAKGGGVAEPPEPAGQRGATVGRRIRDAILRLAFCRNFTLPASATTLSWAPGLGPQGRGPAQSAGVGEIHAQVAVLRALVSLCTEPLYCSPSRYEHVSKPFLTELTEQSTAHPCAEPLFFSLINVVASHSHAPSILPAFKGASSHLLDAAIHLLLQLLDSNPGQSSGIDPSTASDSGAPTSQQEAAAHGRGPVLAAGAETSGRECNVFQQLLGAIDDSGDFELLLSGITCLLHASLQEGGEKRVLKVERRRVDCHQELLVLLWKLLEGNAALLDFTSSTPDVLSLVEPVLGHIYRARLDITRVGVIHVGFFCLLLLSSRRTFAVLLNRPTTALEYAAVQLPRTFKGTHADALIHVIYKVIFNGGDRIQPLYSCLLTILTNITPYAKALSVASADHLVTLLRHFMAPKLFYATPQSYIYVKYILESLNNLIQYQADGNERLMYCIVREWELFQRLGHLELPSAPPSAQPPPPPHEADAPPASAGPDVAVEAQDAPSAGAAFPGGDAAASQPDVGAGHDGGDADTVGNGLNGAGLATAGTPAEEAAPSLVEEEPDAGARDGSGPAAPLDNARPAGGAGWSKSNGPMAAPRSWVTDEWLRSVQEELPLATLDRLINALMPQVDDLSRGAEPVTEAQLLALLHNTTLVGLLPLPQPITIRKYQRNAYTDLWFTAYLHGVIFQRQNECSPLPLADGRLVKLFTVTYLDAAPA